jgi:hypothetical protein
MAVLDGLGSRVPDLIQLTTRLLNYAHHATARRMAVTKWVVGDANRDTDGDGDGDGDEDRTGATDEPEPRPG